MAIPKYGRATTFPFRISTSLDEGTGAALSRLADSAQMTVAHTAREALAAGIPVLRERLRSRKRKAAAPDGGNGKASVSGAGK